MALVVIDAGHGGSNPGAVYNGRQEKDDALALSLAVGQILEQNGVDVYYTRTTDIYESPTQKAQEGNVVRGDYFVSIHRNASPYPNQYTGSYVIIVSSWWKARKIKGFHCLRPRFVMPFKRQNRAKTVSFLLWDRKKEQLDTKST